MNYKKYAISVFVSLVTISPFIGSEAYASRSKGASASQAVSFYTQAQLSQSFQPCLQIFPKQDISFVDTFAANMKGTQLCSNNFAVYYSKVTKTPLVVVEKLNAYSIADAKGEDRTDNFYPDPRLKREDSASLADYKGSGKDRGHQAPAADAVDEVSMNQTFALSNMIPQDPTNNRKIWSKLEGDVRKYAARAAANVYVYTGPLFGSGQVEKMGSGQVWVPTYLFKIVYDEAKGQAWGWILPNTAEAQLGRPMTYAEFERQTSLKLLKTEWLKK